MSKHLQQILADFFHRHLDLSRPLLLALSGGPDSLALFYLLHQYREQHQLQFAAAHIDHGWRDESAREAEHLQELAKEFNVPFHLKRLDPQLIKGNLEAACREERLKLFHALSIERGYQATVLAHHADDQAETVLKRVLEGADLPNLSGLQEEACISGVKLWRPFLSISKLEIAKWLEEFGAEGFQDSTNLDFRFLRGRFRTHIIPFLSKAFGKEITSSLNHVGMEAQELKDYLKDHLGSYFRGITKGPFGSLLDLSGVCPEHPFEIRYVIRELCRRENFFLSRACVDIISELVMENKSNRKIAMGGHTLYIDRRRVFVVHGVLQELSAGFMSLLVNGLVCGRWKVTVSTGEETLPNLTGWEALWKGRLEFSVPEGEYKLGLAHLKMSYPGEQSSLSKWWTNEKVPAFMRNIVPVIYEDGRIVHEFLSGRVMQERLECGKFVSRWMHIVLEAI